MSPRSVETAGAVDRALDVLMAFRPGDRALPVAELLRRLDLSRPTLYRLLATLQRRGFLVAEGEPMRLRLGPAVAHLSNAWRTSLDLGELAAPMLRRVWERSGETAALFVRDDIHRVCVAELESTQPLKFRRGVGYRERLVRGASGRAILAFTRCDAAFLRRLYAGTALDPAEQADDLATIRRRGHAVSRDELIEGAVALAAPVFDATGEVIASLGVFGPGVRLKTAKVAELAALLKAEAALLGAELGHRAGGTDAG